MAIPRDFGAVPLRSREGWTAWFIAPGVGYRTLIQEGVVTRENGKPVAQVFPTQVEAELAAARAKDHAEEQGRAPLTRRAITFRAVGQGRHRRMESAR